MHVFTGIAAAAAIALGTLAPALAQDRPANLYPTRDVAITYKLLGAPAGQGVPQEIGIAYLAAERKMRLDMGAVIPGMNAWGLTDMASGRTDVVMENMRAVMANPGGADVARGLRLAETARMTRADTATVAGLRCTNWRYDNEGQRGTACLTDDGVMLRASNEQGQGMEATRVTYAAQDPTRFRVPTGYQQMDMQQMMRAMGAMPPQQRPGQPPAR